MFKTDYLIMKGSRYHERKLQKYSEESLKSPGRPLFRLLGKPIYDDT